MLLLLHLSPPPSKLLLLEQSTRQASSSSSSSSWCDVKIEMMRQHRQTLLLGAKLRWFLKLFCVPLRLALLACLLACFRKGFALGSYVKAGDGVKEEEEEEALA
jgi:hypothetical protein